ncbi:MAG TPA: glycosyltransferase, partial [Armatimonadota bacterium]|nr:glycosyltransferase [Armatimonadota bacterium]
PTPYRYLNAGALLAERDALIRVLAELGVAERPVTGDDQALWTDWYLADPSRAHLDTGCELFQVTLGAELELEPAPGGRVRNRLTETEPLILHGAARSDLTRPILWAGLDRDAPLEVSRLGIGIITYNRLASLQRLVAGLRQYTSLPVELVVADDGSTDGTAAWCRSEGIRVVRGDNRGVAWNKNRALAWLLEWSDCDPIALLEDDARVWEPGWQEEWVRAAAVWGHVNWSHHPPERSLGGCGTPEDPFRFVLHGGQCTFSEREALAAVGYLDTRFKGYGWEHREWTRRFGRHLRERWGNPPDAAPCLSSHVGVEFQATSFNQAEFERNRLLLDRLHREPVYRPPARTAREALMLGQELAQAGAQETRSFP